MTMMNRLVWRLSKLPTVEELLQLVKDKVITQDEAKEVLFSSETEEDRDKKSLESEIKFLRELVEKLSNDKSRIVEIIREVEKPIYIRERWWQPYYTWCGGTMYYATNTLGIDSSMVGGTAGISTTSQNAYSLNAMDCSSGPSTQSFSDIKTF